MITPIPCMTSSEAMKPPMLTIPDAVPSVAPGRPTEITTTRTTSSHSGARPGSASTIVHATALLAMMLSTRRDLRCGRRQVKIPTRTPEEMAATTETVSRVPATVEDRPWATVRYGTTHISANTVTENCVPMCVKKPSRVPGRNHTVLTLTNVSRIEVVSYSTTWPPGASRTRSSVSTIDSTPTAATDR